MTPVINHTYQCTKKVLAMVKRGFERESADICILICLWKAAFTISCSNRGRGGWMFHHILFTIFTIFRYPEGMVKHFIDVSEAYL
jgi:hypothetical protein